MRIDDIFRHLDRHGFVLVKTEHRKIAFANGVAVLVDKLDFDVCVRNFHAFCAIHACVDKKFRLGIVLVELRACVHILYARVGKEHEVDVAIKSGYAPHILVFEITARRIAVDDDFQLVFADFYIRRNVIFLIIESVLAVTYERAVDIHFRSAVGCKIDMYASLDFVKRKIASVHAARIFVFVDVRLAARRNRMRIANIRINGLAVTFELPVGRHFDFVPLGRPRIENCRRNVIFEIPFAVEENGFSFAVLVEGKTRTVLLFNVDAIDVGVVVAIVHFLLSFKSIIARRQRKVFCGSLGTRHNRRRYAVWTLCRWASP